MPDVVGEDDEEAFGVEQLALAEKAARVALGHEAPAAPAGAVQDEDRIPYDAVGILARLPDGPIVDPDCGGTLATLERDVARDEIVLDRVRIRRLRGGGAGQGQQEDNRGQDVCHGTNLTRNSFGHSLPVTRNVRSAGS